MLITVTQIDDYNNAEEILINPAHIVRAERHAQKFDRTLLWMTSTGERYVCIEATPKQVQGMVRLVRIEQHAARFLVARECATLGQAMHLATKLVDEIDALSIG